MNKALRLRINKPSVVYEKFDDELVLINLDSGNYYSFEKVGADIWGFIQSGASETEIIEEISQRYAESLSTIEDAVKKFLSELKEEGLIVPDETQEAESTKVFITKIASVPKQKNSFLSHRFSANLLTCRISCW